MRTWTLGVTFWMRFRRSRAISSVMPAFRWTSIWPRPLPTVLGSSALNSFGDSWRRAAFSRRTCRAALARSSLAESMRMTWSCLSNEVCVSLKSKRVPTSRRAWSIALVSSAGSNSDTTSKENSATRVQNRVDAGVNRGGRQSDPEERAHDQEGSNPYRALVERFQRRLVIRVGAVVEVGHALFASALHQLIQHRLAAWRKLLARKVGDRLLEVVASASELGDDHVEGLGRSGRRVPPAQVRDDCIEAHIRDSFRSWGPRVGRLTLKREMSVETKSKAAAKKSVTHPNTWVFYDGEFGRYHDIKLGLMTHALHYGTGCFEGIRAYWNPKQEQLYLLHAPAHYERLRRSANIMRMTVPYSTEELVNLTVELLRRNEFKSDVYVRPLLYASSEEIGVRLHNLNHSFFIYSIPFGNYVEIEGGIDRTDLYTCDELLLCGTGAQISPVIEVDRRPVGDGKVGEFTQELQN